MTGATQQSVESIAQSVGTEQSSGVPAVTGACPQARDTFAADELAIVLSHFDTGTIEGIQEYPRGSRKSPKLLLKTDSGLYLLKRRAKGKDDPYKVAFCHELQLYLSNKKFPLPQLQGTRKDNNSMLQRNGKIYELFEYIKGTSYDYSLEATAEAGKTLGLFHKLAMDYTPGYEPPQGSYHASRAVTRAIEVIPASLAKFNPSCCNGKATELRHLLEYLSSSYNVAAESTEREGLVGWPAQIVHSDWHPGNMLFRGHRVVAVIDYDAARVQQRVVDVANGALQFSIIGGADDPEQWPDHIDDIRFKRFLRGYDAVPNSTLLSHAELRVIPWLMIEALIAESVIPVAATGMFARIDGLRFLKMVGRKVQWLQDQSDKLARVLA